MYSKQVICNLDEDEDKGKECMDNDWECTRCSHFQTTFVKEEAIKVIKKEYLTKGWYLCGNCKALLNKDRYIDFKYCPCCGKEIKWDEHKENDHKEFYETMEILGKYWGKEYKEKHENLH